MPTYIPDFFIKFPLQNKLNSAEPVQAPNSLEPENKNPIDILPEIVEETKNPKIITKNPGPYRGVVFSGAGDRSNVSSTDALFGTVLGGNNIDKIRCFVPTFFNHLPRPDKLEGCSATIACLYPEFISADPSRSDRPSTGNLVWCNFLDRMNFDDPVFYNKVHDQVATLTSFSTSSASIVGTATTPPSSTQGSQAENDQNATTKQEVLNKVLQKFSPTPNVRQKGIDYYGGPDRPTVQEMIESDIKFAMRYVPYGNAGKGITKQELDDLLNAGLSVGFIFQRYGEEFLATQREVNELGIKLGDSYNAGVKIAEKAKKGMDGLGIPDNIPIYFAFEAASVPGGLAGDRDISLQEVPKIIQFLRGCGSVVGKNRVGMYGGGISMIETQKANVASYFLQARGWTRERTQTGQLQLYPFTNILQYKLGNLRGKPVVFNIEISPSGLYRR